MGSPTDNDVRLADRLAAVEGAVARRDAIADALADAYESGVRDADADETAAASPLVEPWDVFFAAALGAVHDPDSTGEDVDTDVTHAVRVANTMMKKRQARKGEGT